MNATVLPIETVIAKQKKEWERNKERVDYKSSVWNAMRMYRIDDKCERKGRENVKWIGRWRRKVGRKIERTLLGKSRLQHPLFSLRHLHVNSVISSRPLLSILLSNHHHSQPHHHYNHHSFLLLSFLSSTKKPLSFVPNPTIDETWRAFPVLQLYTAFDVES